MSTELQSGTVFFKREESIYTVPLNSQLCLPQPDGFSKNPKGEAFSLIYINLPPPTLIENYSKSPVLLRHLVSHQLKKMYWKNKGLAKEKSLAGCMCNALPSTGRRKDGSFYDTKQPGCIEIHNYHNEADILEVNETSARHGYVGLQRCGSAMRCPVCGARIRYVRRNEIQEISKFMINNGYSFVFQTLTAPHDFKTDPKVFIKQFQEANRELKKTRSWKLFSDRWQLKHYIRAVEVTDDHPDSKKKSGIHFHSHSIIFMKRKFLTELETKQFKDELSRLWVRALLKVGLITEDDREKTLIHGTDVQRPRVKNQGELSDPVLIKKLIEYVCKGAAFEMSPGTISGKEGRKKDRISHWELMKMALLERQHLQPRLFHIMTALKGIAHLYFSNGLKDLCLVDDVSDEKIMKGKKDSLLLSFNTKESQELWKTIKRGGQQKPVLVAIDEGSDPHFAVQVAGSGCSPLTGEQLVEPLSSA